MNWLLILALYSLGFWRLGRIRLCPNRLIERAKQPGDVRVPVGKMQVSPAWLVLAGWARRVTSRRARMGAFAVVFSCLAIPTAPAKSIILIGGKKSHGVGQHDFPNGIAFLSAEIKAAPLFAGFKIAAFPNGWPAELKEMEDAATVLFYLDGLEEIPAPLSGDARIGEMRKLMARGVGIICLHQASTVPPGDTTIPLVEWLGARRNGMVDRINEQVTLLPASPSHPISSGLGTYSSKDEFYPSLEFADRARITPILMAIGPSRPTPGAVVAWAFSRADGGRAFGYTGGHYLTALQEAPTKKMILNAIAWTSHLAVPTGGVGGVTASASAPARP